MLLNRVHQVFIQEEWIITVRMLSLAAFPLCYLLRVLNKQDSVVCRTDSKAVQQGVVAYLKYARSILCLRFYLLVGGFLETGNRPKQNGTC